MSPSPTKRLACVIGANRSLGSAVKTKILLTRTHIKELKVIFDDYGMTKPGWLMQVTKLTRTRRATLNLLLFESGVDISWCAYATNDDSWTARLHEVWHGLNR
jgi:hypothetical protein